MSTFKPLYDATDVAMTVTNLNSLASSATAGWQSARVSNLSTLYDDFQIFVKLTMANTAPANDKAVYVYALAWYTDDNGTTWFTDDGGTATLPGGTEGTYTIASPNNMRPLMVMSYTTQQMIMQKSAFLSTAFGQFMPHAWSLVIVNFTGAAVAASTNLVDYAGINEQSV